MEAVKTDVGQEPHGPYQVRLADADGNEIDLVPGDEISEGSETADSQALFGAMAFYPTASALQASELAQTVAGLADNAGVPLLVDLRPEGVLVDSGKDQWEDDQPTDEARFADLAGAIQTAAHDLGLSADPTRSRFVQLGIDAVDVPRVRDFWATVLGYQHDPRPPVTDIYDPRRLNPVIMFQQMEASDTDRRQQRNRIHLDLFVPDDQAQARIDAAVAAGGRIVGEKAVGHCRLADPEGNELDIIAPARR